MQMLRLPTVLCQTGYRSQATIYGRINKGIFPKPVKIGERSSAWPSDEVESVCWAQAAGATENELRTLVDRLHQKRAERLQNLLA